MFDFTSGFWSWFIILLTVGSFAGVLWLILWMSEKRKEPGAKAETMGHVWDEDLAELNNPLPQWWLIMFYITIAFGAVYLLLYPGLGSFRGLLNWTQHGRYDSEMRAAEETYGPLYEGYLKQDIKTLSANPEALKTGHRLFVNYCAVCHGSDARGATGFPNLRDTDWLYGGDPMQIQASIANGRSGAMPAWEAALGKDGVFNVTEYVISLSGRPVNETAASLGREKYQQMCVACHGADGTGNTAIGAPNLADSVWLYGGSQRAVMDSIANGRQGNMPPHSEFLGEAKVHLLAAYVYSLSTGVGLER